MLKYFRYKHTNCFFLTNANEEILVFDAGWPCSLYEYKRQMKSIDCGFDRIRACVVSHVHMDHAGLVGEFLSAGITCYMTEAQASNIGSMERIILGNKEYMDYARIEMPLLSVQPIEAINAALKGSGMGCVIMETKGHSDDSISLLTDDGEALIGDLPSLDQLMEDDHEGSKSWMDLIDGGAKVIYPSHAEAFAV